MDDRINPAFITDKETGERFELDFSRESVKFAESRGFKLESASDFPVTYLPDLFYYAFRMHHRNVSRDKTDKLLEKMGGFTEGLILRLGKLYVQAQTSNMQLEEELEKNAKVTLEL